MSHFVKLHSLIFAPICFWSLVFLIVAEFAGIVYFATGGFNLAISQVVFASQCVLFLWLWNWWILHLFLFTLLLVGLQILTSQLHNFRQINFTKLPILLSKGLPVLLVLCTLLIIDLSFIRSRRLLMSILWVLLLVLLFLLLLWIILLPSLILTWLHGLLL